MRALAIAAALALALGGCSRPLTPDQLQVRVERVFGEVNPGFGVASREGHKSVMVRGDQLHVIKTSPLFDAYKASGQSADDWLDGWRAQLETEAKARRRTLDQSKDTLRPIIKSGSWVRMQDLGAIGPKAVQDKIRPWRKPLAPDLFVVLGVPEEMLGNRYASVEEVASSTTTAEVWLTRATANLVRQVGTATGGVELRRADGRLMVFDMPNEDGVAGLILDPGFRKQMLAKFDLVVLGAAIPNRDVLILFDAEDFVTTKPIAARAHVLHDERNHPGFRGLLRFDETSISILEVAYPEAPQVEPQAD